MHLKNRLQNGDHFVQGEMSQRFEFWPFFHTMPYLCHLVLSLCHLDSNTHDIDAQPGEHQQDGHDEAAELQEAAIR